MIMKDFIPQQANRLLIITLILFCLSCSSFKASDSKSMSYFLNNYIESYKEYNFEDELNVMIISTKLENGVVKYIISDAPREVFLGDLKKFKNNNNHPVFMGTYNNILCKIHSDSLQKFQHLFKRLEKNIIDEASQVGIVKSNDGKIYNLDTSLTNWTPRLTIIYDVTKNTKEVIVDK